MHIFVNKVGQEISSLQGILRGECGLCCIELHRERTNKGRKTKKFTTFAQQEKYLESCHRIFFIHCIDQNVLGYNLRHFLLQSLHYCLSSMQKTSETKSSKKKGTQRRLRLLRRTILRRPVGHTRQISPIRLLRFHLLRLFLS